MALQLHDATVIAFTGSTELEEDADDVPLGSICLIHRPLSGSISMIAVCE